MESADYLRGKRDAGNEIYRAICAAAVNTTEAMGEDYTWSDAAACASDYADTLAAQATPEEDLGTAPPKRSGTIKVTLTRGGSGKPLECGEGDEAEGREGATWEVLEACEKALLEAQCYISLYEVEMLTQDLLYASDRAVMDDDKQLCRTALALIAEARKGGK